MTTTDFPAPPEPGLTAEEVVRRAEEIAPSLVERQAETEKRTYYAPDTHELFSEAGFYRILVPRRYGGYEFGIETFLGVSAALARGCPSTGWMFSLGAAHTLIVATLFGEQAQAELFSSGEFICPATVAPSGTAVRTGGGWTLEGTWNYCSGSPYATHFLGHTLVPAGEGGPPAPMAFVIPRSEWTRLDDWGHYLGLKGSGSHSIRIERGALDAYEELLRTRTTFYPPIIGRGENADYQTWHGSALGALATAEAALESAGRQWADLCTRRPGAFGRTEDLKLAAVCGEIIGLCWRAVEQHLFRTAGSGAIREGQRIERAWRDLSMMHSHAGTAIFLPTEGARALSQAHLGIETAGFSTR